MSEYGGHKSYRLCSQTICVVRLVGCDVIARADPARASITPRAAQDRSESFAVGHARPKAGASLGVHAVEECRERDRHALHQGRSTDYVDRDRRLTEACQHKMLIGQMTPSQCRAARALVDMTQPNLAKAAEVGLSTVVDFERSRRQVSLDAVAAIEKALSVAGVIFVEENGEGPGVRLRKR